MSIEITDEMVRLADEAYWGEKDEHHVSLLMRRALAAAAPLIEAQAREMALREAAEDIATLKSDCAAWGRDYDEMAGLLRAERAIRMSAEKRYAELEQAVGAPQQKTEVVQEWISGEVKAVYDNLLKGLPK